MTPAQLARLRADLLAALRQREALQHRWGVAKHTSSSTDDPDDLDVELAQVAAVIAKLEEQLAGTGAEPAHQSPSLPRAPSAVDLGALPANDAQPAAAGFIDAKEASALLGVSVKTLEALRARGDGPPWVRVGRRVRYERARLLEWTRSK